MKLKLKTVLCIHLLLRICFLVCYIKNEELRKPVRELPIKLWRDSMSKRVFLILINGLQMDFLQQNSTPFLRKVVETNGSFGITSSDFMETNFQGLQTILTGRPASIFPLSAIKPICGNTILDYIKFKCGMGNIPPELNLQCYVPDENPLKNFHKLLPVFWKNITRSSFYLLSFDFDPVLVKDYRRRLREIDDDVRLLVEAVDRCHGASNSTYILTSARGSPLGKNAFAESPVVVWGKGIVHLNRTSYLGKSDLTALMCILLGISFPSGLFGIVPMDLINCLDDNCQFEINLHMIKHFEVVVGGFDQMDHFFRPTELRTNELLGLRMDGIMFDIKRSQEIRKLADYGLLLVLMTVWGLNLVSSSINGFSHDFFNVKGMFLMLAVLLATFASVSISPGMIACLEFAIYWNWNNIRKIYETFSVNFVPILISIVLIFAAVTFVSFIGSRLAVSIIFIPVLLWPVTDFSFKAPNRFVVFIRLLSGIVLTVLPHCRVFGETPNRFFVLFVGFLFLAKFYFLFFLLESKVDNYVKINSVMIIATMACIHLNKSLTKDFLSWFLLVFSLLFPFLTYDATLSRLFKIFLSLLIPVIMLSFKVECIFYLSVVFQMFTWIFLEYHSTSLAENQSRPPIVLVNLKKSVRPFEFIKENCRLVVFFIIYCYLSYFAIGHFPHIHSYDFYVIPEFFYDYPKPVSYFLGAFKFFLPFFIVTASFVALCSFKGKNFFSLILMSLCVSDVISYNIIFYSQIVNIVIFQKTYFPISYFYFYIHQVAVISVILSCFVCDYLLFRSEKFFKILREKMKCNKEKVGN